MCSRTTRARSSGDIPSSSSAVISLGASATQSGYFRRSRMRGPSDRAVLRAGFRLKLGADHVPSGQAKPDVPEQRRCARIGTRAMASERREPLTGPPLVVHQAREHG
jgi:hypothetical protein